MSFRFALLFVTYIQCYEWCPLVKPNGTYEGLGFYHHFVELGTGDYVMFNRAGSEWNVKFQSDKQLTLSLLNNSVKSVEDKGILYKFGTFAKYESKLGKPGGRPRDCSVITTVILAHS